MYAQLLVNEFSGVNDSLESVNDALEYHQVVCKMGQTKLKKSISDILVLVLYSVLVLVRNN